MRNNQINIPSVLSSIVLLGFLAGCSNSGGGDNGSVSEAEQGPSAFEDVSVEVDEMGEPFVRAGQFFSGEALSLVSPGVSREEVRSTLGKPLESSGDDWWFYNVSLPLYASVDMDDYLVCQYRVGFGNAGMVEEADWRRPQCRDLYANMLAMLEPEEVVLSSDLLFGYDSYEISADGAQELNKALDVINQELNLLRLTIIGHSDRLGDASYNQGLSVKRAEAVGNYLISMGVPANVVVTEGRGSSDPVVFCDGDRITESLKKCLQRNRRVEITIEGLL